MAFLVEAHYEKGLKIAKEQQNELVIEPHTVQPKQNYTLQPQQIQALPIGEVSCQRANCSDSNLLSAENRKVKMTWNIRVW